jgi:small subunit ribosomal protein S4
LLESRLDNVVFRSGFAPTIPSARQLVNHGHFMVNGRRVDIASYQVRAGDVLTLRERSLKLATIKESLDMPSLTCPEWLDVDKGGRTATVSAQQQYPPSRMKHPFRSRSTYNLWLSTTPSESSSTVIRP